ncbi:unnamed protein product [Mytilus coruscus]|uniref:Reverse transcriptase domain-containing protein n=1 Tax=Mytilus coruscus TaxID=42192 RepID=A0A6J8C5E6_MYTCO|nr:unnamed protein product [Mytilus coruscus]
MVPYQEPFDNFLTELRTRANCNFQEKDLNKVTHHDKFKKKTYQPESKRPQTRHPQSQSKTSYNTQINNKECNFCGYKHERKKEKCPAWGKTCDACKGRNHFKAKCKKIHSISSTQSDPEEDDCWLNAITGHTSENVIQAIGAESKNISALMNVNDCDVRFQLDSAADVNTICKRYIRKEQVKPSTITLQNWRSRRDITLKVDENIPAKTLPSRKLPLSLQDDVKKEIDKLVERQVLIPVTEPSKWVSQMAVVRKPNGKLRICIDLQPLNTALMREHYKLPTLDDVLPKLANAKIFSRLDVREAYWHVKLDKESSDLTTMITTIWAIPLGDETSFGLKVSSLNFSTKAHRSSGRYRRKHWSQSDQNNVRKKTRSMIPSINTKQKVPNAKATELRSARKQSVKKCYDRRKKELTTVRDLVTQCISNTNKDSTGSWEK